MKEIYMDSFTILKADVDTLYISHRGSEGSMSFTEILGVRGRSEASFVPMNNLLQPLVEVTIDALSQPAAFTLAVPADGDGNQMIEVINSLRII